MSDRSVYFIIIVINVENISLIHSRFTAHHVLAVAITFHFYLQYIMNTYYVYIRHINTKMLYIPEDLAVYGSAPWRPE